MTEGTLKLQNRERVVEVPDFPTSINWFPILKRENLD